MITSVSLVTGKTLSIDLYIYISMFHLNWPVMETDLWSLYLFPYLLYLLISFMRIIEPLR